MNIASKIESERIDQNHNTDFPSWTKNGKNLLDCKLSEESKL